MLVKVKVVKALMSCQQQPR